MKKAHYDETTQKLLGWYDTKIHKTIPTPNIGVLKELVTLFIEALNCCLMSSIIP